MKNVYENDHVRSVALVCLSWNFVAKVDDQAHVKHVARTSPDWFMYSSVAAEQ